MLLVLAVLAGVLGMHGLAPGAAPAGHAGSGHQMTRAAAHDAPHADGACAHPGEGSGSGHIDHADAACAAAGVGTGYTPPAPAGALLDAPTAAAPAALHPGTPHDGRAPPELSELQLLRI
ncbi:DUF6153 family protein [Streptomyces thermospinosisporus]|uniref:DUF6153 family protein n=1 Tax=Streptomyces thermospinosisporus TaxID=161482 RepID=A0ABP4J6G7_9ACTN